MLQITIFPESVGGRISENGNPQILGIDEKSGAVIAIEVNSANWKQVLTKLGQLQGVGIIPSNLSAVIPTGKDNHGG